jgi:hypothetical protein
VVTVPHEEPNKRGKENHLIALRESPLEIKEAAKIRQMAVRRKAQSRRNLLQRSRELGRFNARPPESCDETDHATSDAQREKQDSPHSNGVLLLIRFFFFLTRATRL